MSAYSDLVLATTGLASYWRLDDPSGSTCTADFGAITGTYGGGGGVTLNQTGILPGDPTSPSIFLNHSVPGSVDFGDNYDFVNVTPYSLEVWVKPSPSDGDDYVWTKGSEATGGWLTRFATPNIYTQRIDAGGGDDQALDNPGVVDGKLYHVVTTFSGTVLKLYLDGVEAASLGSTRNLPNLGTTIKLGCDSSGGSGFNGYVQDASIYTVALDAATVLAHYNAGVTFVPPGGPIAWVRA